MIKRAFFSLVGLVALTMGAMAQNEIAFGYLSYEGILQAMPEYATAQVDMDTLRARYEAEALYNEKQFRQMFTNFLEGQKDFPQTILLKRQRGLQDAMEQGIAFRASADSLLAEAEKDMLAPLKALVDSAITLVGLERGYIYILNTDTPALPFLHPQVSEDATPYVLQKLNALREEY